MKIGRKTFLFIILCIGAAIIYSFLQNTGALEGADRQTGQAIEEGGAASGPVNTAEEPAAIATDKPSEAPEQPEGDLPASAGPSGTPASSTPTDKPVSTKAPVNSAQNGEIAVIAQPELIAVLVNKQNKLPDNYEPTDLVYPDVRFLFDEKIEKRMLREEAAEALEKMFKAAEDDGIHLAGASAYRSHKTQIALFERYVKKDGMEKALTYSAYPGTSEHETGLAIDVSGSSGKCAVQDCFADEKESDWLKENVFEYGFIIRYPEGKETITGYQYEPWHLRYVGTEIALVIKESGDSLEEYYNAIPVSR